MLTPQTELAIVLTLDTELQLANRLTVPNGLQLAIMLALRLD